MRIAIVGTGYVGLVSAACFAELGVETVGVDKDLAKLEALKAGVLPLYEPGLDEIVTRNVERQRLRFTDDLGEAVAQADAVFIAVGTPTRDGDGKADLSAVFDVARGIAPHLNGYTVVVTKSTVPVGTGAKIDAAMRRRAPNADFDVASNPEFLREGAAVGDFLAPDRVLLGTNSARALNILHGIYDTLSRKGVPIVETDRETAELSKYAANSFLATKIAFINQVADLCECIGGNVIKVAEAIGLDPRIGHAFLNPGPGYGGSCFPKDTRAFVATASALGANQDVVARVIDANEMRKQQMAARIIDMNGGSLHGKSIAVLGLTFKANTDDMRESPSLVIVPALRDSGAEVRCYDPAANGHAAPLLPGVRFCKGAYDAAYGADCVVILTEWPEFGQLDLKRLYQSMKGDILIDLRNLYNPDTVVQAGFNYISVGRPPALLKGRPNIGLPVRRRAEPSPHMTAA